MKNVALLKDDIRKNSRYLIGTNTVKTETFSRTGVGKLGKPSSPN